MFPIDYKNRLQELDQQKSTRKNKHKHVALLSIAIVAALIIAFSLPDPVSATKTPEPSIIDTELSFAPSSIQTFTLAIPKQTPTSEPQHAENTKGDDTQRRDVTVKKGDTLSRIFQREQINQSDLALLLSSKESKKLFHHIKPGQVFTLDSDSQGQLIRIAYKLDETTHIEAQRHDDGYAVQHHHAPTEKRVAYAAGKIEHSLFLAGQAAGLTDDLTMELANIFGWDVDFALDIRKGDEFRLVYEEIYLNGDKIKNGAILAAEFINAGKSFRAIRYTNKDGHSSYYTPEGYNMRKSFLRTPVAFSRISSRFNLKRKHPVLNRIRAHKGVDYAAPKGTPVRAAGAGKIIHRSRKGGYGKVVILQHGQKYSTLYAHLSSYKRGQRVGKRVNQGDIIGYVGSTGLATGPHLHYEFRVNGVHVNPLTVKLPRAKPIAPKYQRDFAQHTQPLLAQLALLNPNLLAFNEQ